MENPENLSKFLADVKAYTEKHELQNLFHDIMQELFINKPDDPKAHIVQFLKKGSKKIAVKPKKEASKD